MNAFAGVRHKIAATYAFLIAFNAVAWIAAFAAFRDHPLLLGTALLAYTFGLRHAVDADHIAAIDSVTRKLMHDGKRPVSVGLYFSLGHSTIVVLLSVAIAFSANAVRAHIPFLQSGGDVFGTAVSAAFLLAIAFINIWVLAGILRAFRAVRAGGEYDTEALDESLAQRGILGRIFRPVLRMVDASWKMYPVGVLFGLGFDTATEVGLLGIAAIEAGKGLPIADILIFPFLFTAGMSLLDTTDGVLMLGAYGWAYVRPERKLYYNMTVTFVSIFVALFVGGVECINLIASHLNLTGGFWSATGAIGDHLGAIGCAIVAIFLAGWLVSTVIYRLRSGEEVEAKA